MANVYVSGLKSIPANRKSQNSESSCDSSSSPSVLQTHFCCVLLYSNYIAYSKPTFSVIFQPILYLPQTMPRSKLSWVMEEHNRPIVGRRGGVAIIRFSRVATSCRFCNDSALFTYILSCIHKHRVYNPNLYKSYRNIHLQIGHKIHQSFQIRLQQYGITRLAVISS